MFLCAAMLGACSCSPDQQQARPADPAGAIILSKPVDHLDGPAREPMLVEHPNGTLLVTGYARIVALTAR